MKLFTRVACPFFMYIIYAVHGMLPPGGLESKTTYRFPTFYPPPATATPTVTAMPQMQVTPTSSYLPAPTATGGLIPLPLFNRGPVAPAPFPSGIPNPPAPATLYTLYPPHTSGQCSCRYCTNSTAAPVAALSSHALGTLPVFSAGLNSSLASGVLKCEKEAPPHLTPLTHITEIVPLPHPQPILSATVTSTATQPSTLITTVTVPSPQPGLQEAQTPPTSESMTASQPSPSCSSARSVTPLEQPAFPNTSPCPTLPTSSESASIASGYEHDVCESVITASVPDQEELCAIMYESRRGMKPLYHLPASSLEPLMTSSSGPPLPNGSTSQGNSRLPPPQPQQWMWNSIDTCTASTQPLYEAELPEIPETHRDHDGNPAKEGQDPITSAQVCVDQEN